MTNNNVNNLSFDDLPLFFNPRAFAPLLGISVAKSYEIAKQKDFPHAKFGKRIIIYKEPFLEWIDKNFCITK
jgi:predicted DNA-binding transcriptional regulator AlpA